MGSSCLQPSLCHHPLDCPIMRSSPHFEDQDEHSNRASAQLTSSLCFPLLVPSQIGRGMVSSPWTPQAKSPICGHLSLPHSPLGWTPTRAGGTLRSGLSSMLFGQIVWGARYPECGVECWRVTGVSWHIPPGPGILPPTRKWQDWRRTRVVPLSLGVLVAWAKSWFFLIVKNFNLFLYFWLCWVFIAAWAFL